MHVEPLIWGDYEITAISARDAPVREVLYLLDGNAALGALNPDWPAQAPNLALVAVGYRGTARFDLDRRSRDYTPPPPPGWDGGRRRALDRPHGSADAFLTRLRDEIAPMAETALKLDRPRRGLWGHSYGGLFALWALTRAGHGFSSIHAASPSLWWGDYALETQLLDGTVVPAGADRVMLSMGDNEVSSQGERLYTTQRLADVATALRRAPGIGCHVTTFPGAGHNDAFARSLALAVAAG